jgi:hypothetical protein
MLAFMMAISMIPVVSANAIQLPFGPNTEGVKHLPNITVSPAEVPQGSTPGIVAFRKLVNTVGSFMSLVMGAVAIFALFIAGYQLITAQSAVTEEITTQKMNVIYIIIGLVVFGLSGRVVYDYLFFQEGSYLLTEQALLGQASRTVEEIIRVVNLFLSFSGGIAILILVVSALRLVINPGAEEEVEKEKKLVGYTAVGIIIIGLSNVLINQIVFPGGGYEGVNVTAFEQQLKGLSNYILGFMGVGIFATLVISGVLMVANQGDEDTFTKIKTTMKYILIGTIVVFSAYTIVATLLTTFLSVSGGVTAP